MLLRRQLALLPTLLFAACLSTRAQQPEAAQDAPVAKPYILHAYANLVQVPALALTADFRPLPLIDRDRFFLRIDSGPAFHPTRMHLEGDEPLSLTILIDATGDQDRLIHSLPAALAQLAATALKPDDRLSIYANDCHLIRSALLMTPDPGKLESAVHSVLTAPTLHNGNDHGTCGRARRTWDAAAHAVKPMEDFAGRRVLLLISSGYDHGSVFTTTTLRHFANRESVAIFAIRDLLRFEGDFSPAQIRPAQIYLGLASSAEDAFTELCESTGGLIITLPQDSLVQGLQQFVAMLRNRYILEFPRPDDRIAGEHSIDITIPSTAAFIVSAGVTVPLSDEAIDADPTTVHSSPSPAVIGKRRPLSPQH